MYNLNININNGHPGKPQKNAVFGPLIHLRLK